jgi:hypothetical protein
MAEVTGNVAAFTEYIARNECYGTVSRNQEASPTPNHTIVNRAKIKNCREMNSQRLLSDVLCGWKKVRWGAMVCAIGGA